ncbi:MAG: winged helix DNA-binding domain-containing protein [Candidatus Limnocylindrales bacterium]
MHLTERQLNRATLDRQLLLRRGRLPAVEGVRRVVALQAQEPPSPYIALWNRLAAFEAADLDAAFASGAIVKSPLVRMTLHAVVADDYPPFHAAMVSSLRAARLYDGRFRDAGLTIADADELLPRILEFAAAPRSKGEIEALITERFGTPRPRLWWAYRTYAPLHHVPAGPPWSFGSKSRFRAAPSTLPIGQEAAATRHLVRRYLGGFGPASVIDVTQFTMLRRPVVREALVGLGDGISQVEGPGGAELFDIAGASIPRGDEPAPSRLLPMWDSILLAYADRSRIIPPEYRRRIILQNGDTLPTLLVDGQVAGVWRLLDGAIEASSFHRLTKAEWRGLESEAAALAGFLAARDLRAYSRYHHWWSKLEAAEVRVF